MLPDGEHPDALEIVGDLIGRDTDGRDDRSGGPHIGRSELVADVPPHRGEVGRDPARDDRRDPMEDIGRILARETVPELGEHLVGRRTLAVHDAVGEPLCPATGRLDQANSPALCRPDTDSVG